LNRSTEKTTPKERPRPERMSIEERQRSHCEEVIVSTQMYLDLGLGILVSMYLLVKQSFTHRPRRLCDGRNRCGCVFGHIVCPQSSQLIVSALCGRVWDAMATGMGFVWERLMSFGRQSSPAQVGDLGEEARARNFDFTNFAVALRSVKNQHKKRGGDEMVAIVKPV
jgi:hypothetical protein